MSTLRLVALDRHDIPPLTISERLRTQIVYFASLPPESSPALGEGEYYIPACDVDRFLDDGVLRLVSPLDTANTTEVELSDEQEDLLAWLKRHGVERVRVANA